MDTVRVVTTIIALALGAGACRDTPLATQLSETEAQPAVLPGLIYGACQAFVVKDRDKGIDLSSAEEFFRPAVFMLSIDTGEPVAIELLMLPSEDFDDDELLYHDKSKLLRVNISQQHDIILKDGGRTVKRYRSDSIDQQKSIDVDWYAEAVTSTDPDTLGTERVVRVDFASEPYHAAGARRWGKHYVCHRNAGISGLAAEDYRAQVEDSELPSTVE